MKRTRTVRRRRGAGTLGALGRAALLFGPLGAVLAFATLAGSDNRSTRTLALQDVDDMATGSIAASGALPSVVPFSGRANGGPCLRFPDGSQRGDC